ncbi:MAG: hypothetical protein KAS23_15720 [Anaerohalosphaera sp.]|nr:hypothetical protein [Anaerohalosphaera sp.]
MLIWNCFSKCCLIAVVLLLASTASAALITMDIDALCTESDYDLSTAGNELRIDYLFSNTTQSSNLDDALYRILIPAGVNQSIYSVQVPDQWVAVVRSDDIELYTLNGYEAIQCGESKTFSIYSRNTEKEEAQIEAMTSIGDWAIPVNANVPTSEIPEPVTLLLFVSGACLIKSRH